MLVVASGQTIAPILGTTADGSASAESARSLLLTVLGEFARPTTSGAWTKTLVDLLGGVGVKDKAARQALARMERPGWLERDKRGRTVRWVLGPDLTLQLQRGGARIYQFGRMPWAWDGSWLLLLPGDRAVDRAADFRLWRALRWAGCGPAARGTWICPWTDRRSAVLAVLEAHGVGIGSGANLFESRLTDLGTDVALAAEAWDIDALARQYDVFLDRFGGWDERESSSSVSPFDAACELVRLVHQWRKFPLIDPELPAQLLPADWPGHRAAELFASRRSELLPLAQQWWADAEG